MEIKDDFHEVPVYENRKEIELLKKLKIPTLFAVYAAEGIAVGKIAVSPEGQVTVLQVQEAKMIEVIAA
jgi:hypothetical protein